MNDTQFRTKLGEIIAADDKAAAARFCADEGGAWEVIKRTFSLPPVKTLRKERSAALEIDGFADWYAAYPRRVARKAAARAYSTARKEVDRDVLLAGAKRYAAQVAGTRPDLIKHPATWLNGGCWADEYPAAVPTTASTDRFWTIPAPEALYRLEAHAGMHGYPKGFWNTQKWGPLEAVPEAVKQAYEAAHGTPFMSAAVA